MNQVVVFNNIREVSKRLGLCIYTDRLFHRFADPAMNLRDTTRFALMYCIRGISETDVMRINKIIAHLLKNAIQHRAAGSDIDSIMLKAFYHNATGTVSVMISNPGVWESPETTEMGSGLRLVRKMAHAIAVTNKTSADGGSEVRVYAQYVLTN